MKQILLHPIVLCHRLTSGGRLTSSSGQGICMPEAFVRHWRRLFFRKGEWWIKSSDIMSCKIVTHTKEVWQLAIRIVNSPVRKSNFRLEVLIFWQLFIFTFCDEFTFSYVPCILCVKWTRNWESCSTRRPYCSPANSFDEFCTNISGSTIETVQLFTCLNDCLFIRLQFQSAK
jgi:hypothetical protein